MRPPSTGGNAMSKSRDAVRSASYATLGLVSTWGCVQRCKTSGNGPIAAKICIRGFFDMAEMMVTFILLCDASLVQDGHRRHQLLLGTISRVLW